MDDTLASLLLGSVASENLVFFCGAGLSMAPPSAVPSARALAIECHGKYQTSIGSVIPPAAVDNLEELSRFALGRNELQKLFVNKIVPWRSFFRSPNKGHTALADFLGAGISRLAITTNFDTLVEEAAKALGEDDFRAALDSRQASDSRCHSPYGKIHGCGMTDRENTLWCREQLVSGSVLQQRVEEWKTWLQANLPGKDLVFIGFWSDWDYLNSVFEDCFVATEPRLVVVVDPIPGSQLQAKAPVLWAWATNRKHVFYHAQESGADFLDALRAKFSLQFLENVIQGAKKSYLAVTGREYSIPQTFDAALSSGELYSLRRNLSGVPETRMSRDRRFNRTMERFAVVQMRFVEKGATLAGSRFVLNGRRIRIIQGAGSVLSRVKQEFQEESPALVPDDFVVCVGAADDGGAPAHLVRGGSPSSILRPTDPAEWISDDRAIIEFSI